MKLAVIGSRSWVDFPRMHRLLDKIHCQEGVSLVISGGCPDGADVYAETWAKFNKIETQLFRPEDPSIKSHYARRNLLIAEACDRLIAFWRCSTPGTLMTIKFAFRQNKTIYVVKPNGKPITIRPGDAAALEAAIADMGEEAC